MKPIHNISIYFLIILHIASSCHTSNYKPEGSDINFLIDSLEYIYAPDKRVALWNVSVSEDSNKVRLIGELDSEIAYNKIVELVNRLYPNSEIQINLLPEKGNDQIVNSLANNSVINLRSKSRHSAEIATQVLLGTPLKILKMEREWYLVQTPNKYIAWTDDDAIVKINGEELQEYRKAKKIVFNRQYGFSWVEPDKTSQVVTDLVLGCILQVEGSNGKFYHVQYPDGRLAFVMKEEFVDFEELARKEIDEEKIIETAKKFMGIPYLWGGTSSKAIDCSGFTSTVYFMNGTVLQRDASQQTKYGKEITTEYDYRQLEPGDLLFFGRPATDSVSERVTHVALYMNDSEFIHASGRVKINSIDSTKSNFITTYPPRFIRATRVKGYFDNFGIQRISDNDFFKQILN